MMIEILLFLILISWLWVGIALSISVSRLEKKVNAIISNHNKCINNKQGHIYCKTEDSDFNCPKFRGEK